MKPEIPPTEPVAWHGFRPPRLRPRRRVVLTGHPPPERQIADQVRTSGGYTLGRATVEGARIAPVGARE